MALLNANDPGRIPPEVLARLSWRMVWLHAALVTAPTAAARPEGELLAPRDRDLLALVASSAYGVDLAAASAHLRRLGVDARSVPAVAMRLERLGYLSLTESHLDLPVEDLVSIETRVGER